MSKAFLRLQANRDPKPLIGCSTVQHTVVTLEIEDPDHRRLIEVEMSTDQFLRLMIGNSQVDVTLTSYRGQDGKIAHEVPEMPKTHRENLVERMGEYYKEDRTRMNGIMETLRAMMNGHIKPNKTTLAELLKQMDAVATHRSSNEAFAVRQAEEEVNAIENDVRSGLSLMLAQITGDDRVGQIAETMIPGGSQKALPNAAIECDDNRNFPDNRVFPDQENLPFQESVVTYTPVPAGAPEPLKIPDIPIEEMTSDDLGRAISRILRKMEANLEINPIDPRHGTKHLFGASACAAASDKVNITYVAYQGSSKVDLEVAREMLRRLRTGKFVRHFEIESELKQ